MLYFFIRKKIVSSKKGGNLMDLVGMQVEKNRREMKMTVLYRSSGKWHLSEVSKLVNGLMTEISQHPQYTEYLIVYGHYTKEQTLKVLGGGVAYTATQVIGIQDDKLPFVPGFA
jgi:hypothetical protein